MLRIDIGPWRRMPDGGMVGGAIIGAPDSARGGRVGAASVLSAEGAMTFEKLVDAGVFRECSTVSMIGHGRAQFEKAAGVVGDHHYMTLGAVLEMVVNAFFLTESLKQLKVAFAVLDA